MLGKQTVLSIATISIALTLITCFASTTVQVQAFEANGGTKEVGTITLEEAVCGVLIKPNLHDLPPGLHGFHIHVNPSCDQKGMAAGDHLDPDKTGNHHGPYAEGHLGDLPLLIVNNDGKATLPTLAPRFALSQMKNHAIMIHANGDNYADTPEKLGGGGGRIACGVIK
jgi:Cu-Zn family superoxide dismutase